MSGQNTRFISPYTNYKNWNGQPFASGLLYFYYAHTDDLAPIYDHTGTITQNPHQLDAAGGTSTDIFLDENILYKVIMTDVNGAQIWMREFPVTPTAAT